MAKNKTLYVRKTSEAEMRDNGYIWAVSSDPMYIKCTKKGKVKWGYWTPVFLAEELIERNYVKIIQSQK